MAANKLSHVPDNIESIRVVSASNVTTDGNGYVALGVVKNNGGKTYVSGARCDANNTALIPWMTTDGNWYLSAVSPAAMTMKKSTNIGGIKYLVITLKSV